MRNLFIIIITIIFQSIPIFAQNEIENCDSLIEESSNFLEKYKAVSTNNSETLFYIFILIAFFYGISNWLFPHFFKSLHQSLFNDRIQNKFIKNQINGSSLAVYIVKIFNAVAQAITVYLLHNYFTDNVFSANLDFLLSLIMFFIVFQIIKEVLNSMLSYTFNSRNLIKMHTFNSLISTTFLSYFLLFVSLVFALSSDKMQQYLVYLIMILVIISFGIAYFKALYYLINNTVFNKFRFFIYLCTLEILPLVIFYKLFTNWM